MKSEKSRLRKASQTEAKSSGLVSGCRPPSRCSQPAQSLTFYTLGLTVQGPGLAAQSFSSTINPDIHSLDFLTLRQGHVHLLDAFVQVGARRGGHGGRCSGERQNKIRTPTPNRSSDAIRTTKSRSSGSGGPSLSNLLSGRLNFYTRQKSPYKLPQARI